MPKLVCDIHGALIAPHVCCHLSEKVLAREVPENATFADFDGFLLMGWLCDDCNSLSEVEYFLSGERTEKDMYGSRFWKLLDQINFQPVCPKCFEDLLSKGVEGKTE